MTLKTSEADCWERSSILTTEYLPKEKCLIFSILMNYICFTFNYLILNYKKRIKEEWVGGRKVRSPNDPTPPSSHPPPPPCVCVWGSVGGGGSKVGADRRG